MNCPNCNSQIPNNSDTCPVCGTPLGYLAEEKANTGFLVLSIFVPIFGLVYGILESNKGKKKAGKTYIIAAVVAWVSWFLIGCCMGMIPAFIGAMAN